MSGYSLEDEHGITYYTYHSDRTVCDVEGCTCALPTSAQVYAQRTAEGRDVWLVARAAWLSEPLTGAQARAKVDDLLAKGCKPKLLRVVEDYT